MNWNAGAKKRYEESRRADPRQTARFGSRQEPAGRTIAITDEVATVTSLKQIAANRRNAARSTGPVTAQGKARASRNARRHGFSVPVYRASAVAADIGEFVLQLVGDAASRTELDLAIVIGKRKLILPPVVQNVISRFVAAFMPIFFRFQRFVRFLDAMTRFLPWSINLSPSYLAPTRFGLRGGSANPRKNEETSLMFNNAKPNASRVRVLLDAPKPMMALNHWVVWRWSCRTQVNKPPVG